MLETADRARPSEVVCAECGRGTPGHKPVRPWWPRPVLFGLPLVMAMWLWWQWHDRVGSFQFGAPLPARVTVSDDLTRAGLEAIADGRDEKSRLAARFTRDVMRHDLGFGETHYQAAVLGPGPGFVETSRRYGWPFRWFTVSTRRDYADVVSREGFRAAQSRIMRPPGVLVTPQERAALQAPNLVRPASVGFAGWHVLWCRSVERTGGAVQDWRVSVPRLVAMVVFLSCGAELLLLVFRRVARRREWSRPWARAASGATLLAVAVLFIVPHGHSTRIESGARVMGAGGKVLGFETLVFEGYSMLGVTKSELEALSPGEADRRLAAELVRLIPEKVGPDETLLLSASAHSRNWNTTSSVLTSFVSGAEIVSVMDLYHEAVPDFGPVEPVVMPRGVEWSLGWEVFELTMASGVAGQPVPRIGVDIPMLVMVLTFILAPGVVPVAVYRSFIRRRVARRERERKCVECGYPLATTAGVS